MKKLYFFLSVLCFAVMGQASAQVVINEVYGGGGNTGAVYKNDFIELYNNGNSAVSLAGWSVQYASATGTSWSVTALTATIPAHGYYLVQEAAGAGGTANLPAPDATGTINMSGTAGKVILCNTITAQTGTNPTGAQIIDKVGFGTTANGFEGAGPTPAPSNTNAVQRTPAGKDTDNNNADFTAVSPTPLNSSSSTGGPSIAVTPSSLSGFSTTTGTASAQQAVTASGSSLTADITITPPASFEVSIDGGSSYSALPVTLTQSGGTVSSSTVNVRIAASAAAGSVNGSLAFSSAGATTQNVALSGIVNGLITVDPPGSFSASAVSTTQVDLIGSGNLAGNNILVATNTINVFGNPVGALSAGNTISGGGTVLYNGPSAGFSFQHTGLNAGTAYYYSAWSVDGSNNYSTNLSAAATTLSPPAANVVINQVYGGGGNSGAVYKNDFIELYNNENTPVSLSGWSVQYAGPTGTGNFNVHALSGTIPAHGFFLIQESAGAGGTVSLPTPDATGPLAMGAASGKVILSNGVTALSGANPTGAGVVDKLGYGTANGFETAAAGLADNTSSVTRINDGVDNNNNATDFAVGTPVPRNSGYTSTAPGIFALTPPNTSPGVPYNISLSIIFDKKVVKGSGTITIYENAVAGSPLDVNDASVIIGANNTVSFPSSLQQGKSYYVLVSPGAFKDVYNNNFAGINDAGTWAFSTFNNATGIALPASFDFQACTGTGLLPNGFTQYSVNGNAKWDCTAFGRDGSNADATLSAPNGVQMNGFDNSLGNVLNTDWLISPALDLTGSTYPLLSFYSRTRFNGAPLQLKISTDYTGTGDPNLASWTDLNGKFAPQTSDIWTLSSNINLSAFKQAKVYIAFLYTSTNDDGARWTLDDINVVNSITPPPPSLTLSTNSIEFFYAAAGATVTKQFTVIGNDLSGGLGININSTGSFEVSKDGFTFGNSINLSEGSSNNIPSTVYVRFAPTQNNQNFTGTVTISTFGVTDTIVNVKGTSIDPANTLEVVNWNMEWFGSSDLTLGPVNKAQQKQNAQTVLSSIGADLFALVEVVDTAALGNIVRTSMPGYNYIICNYGSHGNPFESGASPMGALQKEAFVYKTSVFSNVDTTSLLSLGVNTAADLSNPNYNYWSSGRYPFMMTADVTLNGIVKKIHFVAVHAKANTSPTVTAYDRRKNGAIALHDYLNSTFPNDNIVVLGDFNDDLDSTITDGIAPRYSSYKVFTDDAPSFASPTLTGLSLTGKKSTVSYNDVIDHVVVSNEMKAYYMGASAAVLTDVTGLVANYGSTTSDHYPIFTRFAFDAALLPVRLISFDAVKEGNSVKLSWKSAAEVNSREYLLQRSADGISFNSIGMVPAKGSPSEYNFIDAHPESGDNYYRLKPVDQDGKFVYSKVLKINFGRLPGIRISPNPASNWLYISLENINSSAQLQVFDEKGQLVKQQGITQGAANKAISLSGLARGFYTVKLVSQEKVVTQKLMIQ